MRQLGFMTMRAFDQRTWDQMVVGSSSIAPRLGMSSFRIRHFGVPDVRIWRGQAVPVFGTNRPPAKRTSCHSVRQPTDRLILQATDSPQAPLQSPLSEAKGDSFRGSGQWHFSRFRLAPQTGQSPRHSGPQTIFMGTERMTCSVTTSGNATPSPE